MSNKHQHFKANTCRHYNGGLNDCCEAGINYKQLAGEPEYGYLARLPCWANTPFGKKEEKVSCDKFALPTVEEVNAWEAFVQERISQQMKVAPLIVALKKEYKGRSGKVVRECPVCGGKLHMSIAAYNGHVHGQCETKGCLSWME